MLRLQKNHNSGIYFVTFSVNHLFYIFDRCRRFEIIENSFVYCQKNNGLKVYAYVFMLNHIHFIVSSPNMIGLIREMKTFLSKELRRNIRKYEPRVEKMFMDGDKFKFWKENNSSKLIESEWFMEQKVDYIHMNPVKKLYVYDPEDWMWSSASKVPGRIKLSQY